MKKVLIVTAMIFLPVCALCVGLWLWFSIMGVSVGNFDWFPRE